MTTGVAGERRRRRWDPREVGWGGAGCALVRRSVSQSVHAPRAPACLACGALPRQGPGLAPPALPQPASLALSPGLHWVLPLVPPGPAWGRPSPPARAPVASPSSHAPSVAPSRSSPIYEARSHHVLMSLCPALAAAAAQTPPRELRGEGPARGAQRRPRLQTLLAPGTRRGAGPGARGDEPLRPAPPTSLSPLPPRRPLSRGPPLPGTGSPPGYSHTLAVPAPSPTSGTFITSAPAAPTPCAGVTSGAAG